ncbi:MAG: hypothetical protein BWY31_00046 [Lentisphaerae bacterium ADurb.Bin242]|nr:MAG: hypothetical protein BWY31_00046 [Lentisphaerae bacterium ADurb.Bin242]
MTKLPVTVLIPTLNAEAHLPELLDSIAWAEDIFLVDSRSLDRTVDIALERGVKIVQRPFTAFGDTIQWMLDVLPVKTPWLFIMAQDERSSASLETELAKLFRGEPDCDGYTVLWRLWFMGQPLHAVTKNLRLFRKGKAEVSPVLVNEHFIVRGKTGRLPGILEHKDSLNLYDWYEKQNLYTTWEAAERIQGKGREEEPRLFGNRLQRKMFFKRFFIRLPGGHLIQFLYYLLKYGAWRDGSTGLAWVRLRLWVHEVGTLKEREMRRTGVIPKLPSARHGDFDPRIMESELQKQLLPELCETWKKR